MGSHVVQKITKELGNAAIREAVGVSDHSIRYARTTGKFPASWYAPIKAMCDERGVDCPLGVFNFKITTKKVGTEGADCNPDEGKS